MSCDVINIKILLYNNTSRIYLYDNKLKILFTARHFNTLSPDTLSMGFSTDMSGV